MEQYPYESPPKGHESSGHAGRILVRKSRRVKILAAVAVVSVPVLYLLALGPLSWLQTHGYLSNSVSTFCDYLYGPVWYVPILKDVLYQYARLWDG